MPTINQLSSTSSLSGGDQLPVYDASEGDARKASLSTLLAFFTSNFASPEFETVTAAPSASGFTVALDASTDSIWLILNPTGAFAAGTVQLPPAADCFDGQTIVVVCSQALTALTVDGNGSTVAGAPSGLGTNGFFSLRYQASATKWWCTSQSLGSAESFTDLTLTGSILSGDGETMLTFLQEGAGTAVNYPVLVYSTTGNEVALVALGSDAAVGLSLVPKGAGDINIAPTTGDLIMGPSSGSTVVGGGTGAVTITAGGVSDVTVASSDGDVLIEATGTGAVRLVSSPVLPVSTVAGLPTPIQGMLAVVTDANATTHNGIVAGGGANVVTVYHDGTNWRIL